MTRDSSLSRLRAGLDRDARPAYDIRCRFCSARFTPYEWQHHSPECPYVTGEDANETGTP